MQVYRKDLNLLVIFECIYSQESVTKTAELLHLTQPTVSHALKRLREQIDDPLFVRKGKKLAPTPVAQKLIGSVRQAMQVLESSLSDLEEFEPGNANHNFSLGMRPLMEFAHFRPIQKLIQKQAPNITLSSVPYKRDNLESALSSGDISAAIDLFLPLSDNIGRELIACAQAVVVARKDHPAIKNGKLTLENYLDHKHLMISSRSRGHSVEDTILARQGLRRTVATRCQTLTTALDIVENSDLLLTIAENYLINSQSTENHQINPAPFEAPDFEIYLYWHESWGTDKSNQWLRKIITETYSGRSIH